MRTSRDRVYIFSQEYIVEIINLLANCEKTECLDLCKAYVRVALIKIESEEVLEEDQ